MLGTLDDDVDIRGLTMVYKLFLQLTVPITMICSSWRSLVKLAPHVTFSIVDLTL